MTLPFSAEKYFELEKKALADRIKRANGDRLYLEVGGHLMYDAHAAAVLPGFDPEAKAKIIKSLNISKEILYCVNAVDLVHDRKLSDSGGYPYSQAVLKLASEVRSYFGTEVKIVLNFVSTFSEIVINFEKMAKSYDFDIILHNYLNKINPEFIFSEAGFGKDKYIEVDADLVIVTGPASNSGKFFTCLDQIYHESLLKIKSTYAKIELFPIWNLDIKHPVNIAYEAATADIGDYLEWDERHFKTYANKAVNYNRDVETFLALKYLADNFLQTDNLINTYHSPTDMGINMAGFCIENDDAIRDSAYDQIRKRIHENEIE